MVQKKKSDQKPEKDFDAFLSDLGERFKEYRLKKGYTSYEQFAFEHNIGRAQYGRYERGTEDLRISSIYKILKAMDISFEEFFKGLD